MRIKLSIVALLAAAAATVAAPAAAQTSGFTLYGGYRGGGSFDSAAQPAASATLDSGFAGSASIEIGLDAARQIQLFGSYQSTELPAFHGMPALPMSVAYLHLGGTNYFEGQAGRGAYLVGGLGATRLAPSQNGLGAEVRPSMSLGLGWRWPLAPQVALTLEARVYLTLLDSNSNLFCSGGCVVAIRGDLLTQGEAMLGLSFGF